MPSGNEDQPLSKDVLVSDANKEFSQLAIKWLWPWPWQWQPQRPQAFLPLASPAPWDMQDLAAGNGGQPL